MEIIDRLGRVRRSAASSAWATLHQLGAPWLDWESWARRLPIRHRYFYPNAARVHWFNAPQTDHYRPLVIANLRQVYGAPTATGAAAAICGAVYVIAQGVGWV